MAAAGGVATCGSGPLGSLPQSCSMPAKLPREVLVKAALLLPALLLPFLALFLSALLLPPALSNIAAKSEYPTWSSCGWFAAAACEPSQSSAAAHAASRSSSSSV